MELITLTDYKAFAGISSPNQDSTLEPIIEFVNQFVSDYLGYSPIHVEFVESQTLILLPNSQVVAAVGVEELVDGVLQSSVNITGFYQIGFKLFLPTSITGRVTVTLMDSVVNSGVKEACNLLVKHYTKEEYKSQIQSGAEQVQVADPKALPIHIKSILDLYRES